MVKLVTGKEGTVSLHNLPIGSYYLKETDVGNHHFVLDPEVKEFYVSMELENKRQKIELVLTKQSKETKEPVQGAVFGLYAEEDILDLTGEVIVKAGEFLAKAESAEDGTIRFDIDHPHGKYMVKGENLTPVIREFEGIIKDGDFKIADNNLLKTHFLNVALKHNMETRKFRPIKIEQRAHIDGFVSVIDAMTVRQKYWEECGELLKNAA